VGFGQQSPCPIERVVFSASMTDRLVLHPPPAFIEFGVGQFHQVERVGDLGDMIQTVFEGFAVGAGKVQHPIADRRTEPVAVGPAGVGGDQQLGGQGEACLAEGVPLASDRLDCELGGVGSIAD